MAEMTIEQQRALAIASARLRLKETQSEPESNIGAEVGRGLLRGASDVGMTVGKGIAQVADPSGILGAKKAVESLAAPSRSLVKAAPTTEGSRFAGTAAEIVGGAIPAGGVSGLRPAALTAASALGGATGEQVAGEPGKVVGSLAPGALSTIKPGMEWTAKWLMQSGIKPTPKDVELGKAARAVETMLDEGLNPTQGGVLKLKHKIKALSKQVDDVIERNPQAFVDKAAVKSELDKTLADFEKQVTPQADIAVLKQTWENFKSHPLFKFPERQSERIPVATAQELKQGTYKQLRDKYGQLGSAETEGQKSLARGLKGEIEKQVPDVIPLNAEMQKLINALNVTERRALMELNKNPGSLAYLASNPLAAAGFVASGSALFKSLAARLINSAQQGLPELGSTARITAGTTATQGQQ